MATWALHRHFLQLLGRSVPTLPNSSSSIYYTSFSTKAAGRRKGGHPYPLINGDILPIYRPVYEANARNSEVCKQRYIELLEKIKLGGGENAVLRHTQRNKKVLVRERLRMLLDEEPFLELSPFAGLGLPYGDVPTAGCVSGVGKVSGVWCAFTATDATVKGGTSYPISVKKQLRVQEIAMKNRLPTIYLVDSAGAFLPLQAEIFPDKEHGGRTFYNEAVMSSMQIPQVSVVCGSCTAGGAYIATVAEETIIVDRIGTIYLGGPPLVKAATGEDVSSEDLGGAKLHSRVSGCVDYFAAAEEEAYNCVRQIISTFNFEFLPEEITDYEAPLYDTEELVGLAPRDYRCTLNVKLILSRLIDGSRFLEFKAEYGTTLVTGFASVEGHLVGIVASNGSLTHDASLKGSHFVQLCSQRGIPLLFLQNTASQESAPTNVYKAEEQTNRLKAQASMMSSVACATVPKITIVIGGCHGGESFAMCGRSFDPNFLFLWPNARVALLDSFNLPMYNQLGEDCIADESELKTRLEKLKEQSTAFYSSARMWDDGIILPQDSRKVIGRCLRIISQQKYITPTTQASPVLRMC
ncbi:biotin-dependent 3-methylcrotonyl-coenzyme A carboxylase beta1 subunit isoform X2 [Bombina bombina]|uniref:biotin-dependent 3-methylcrotonyl-coenzyme A carboxylase beta1 subunit isoform X2 n=1 Tax=Bombina bombina TaxID=8345 RepID=UPI00235B2C83|nr:biotin-dependent 3-methylcrotonyl-coenzyme A carboxylase beta1 subunit isoform X2 [Bombina bombina]